jgi:hypothetical protein
VSKYGWYGFGWLISGVLLKRLFQKNGWERVKNLFPLVNDWFRKFEKPEMLRTAAQVYGLIFETFESVLIRGGDAAMRCISSAEVCRVWGFTIRL